MYKKIMIVIFAIILIGLPICTFIFMPKEEKAFSENENRYLAEFPTISLKSIEEKKFMNGFDTWLSDRFFGREEWIRSKNITEKLSGKYEISGVFTEDGRMMEAFKTYDKETVDKNLRAMDKFSKSHDKVPSYFLLSPTAQEIYSDTLPKTADIVNQKSFIKSCYESTPNISGIDAYSILNENRDKYIFYRTDHHWTSYGAYLAYTALSSKLDFAPINISKFNIEHASDNFRGTLFSKTLDNSIAPDVIDYYFLNKDEPKVKVSIMKNTDFETYDSLYFREFLEAKDKYSSFLGQNAPIVNIETELPSVDKSIVIFKDSYANSLIPFLSKHYSKITVVDMRYINVAVTNFVNVDDYDQILYLFNAVSFASDTHIAKLNIGLK